VQGPQKAPIELAFTDGIPVLVDYCWGCGSEDFEDVGIRELGMRRSLRERGRSDREEVAGPRWVRTISVARMVCTRRVLGYPYR
jgi:hypothetical protein